MHAVNKIVEAYVRARGCSGSSWVQQHDAAALLPYSQENVDADAEQMEARVTAELALTGASSSIQLRCAERWAAEGQVIADCREPAKTPSQVPGAARAGTP